MSSHTTSETMFFVAELVDENEEVVSSIAESDEPMELDFAQLLPLDNSDCDCAGAVGVDDAAQIMTSINEAPQQQVKVSLLRIRNWPEFKVDVEKKCHTVLGRKICVNVPHAFQRTCTLEAFATVSHPNASSIRADIIACVRQAVAAGAVAGVLAGNVPAAVAALKVALTTCLAAKGRTQLNRLAVNISTETSCGDWKPR